MDLTDLVKLFCTMHRENRDHPRRQTAVGYDIDVGSLGLCVQRKLLVNNYVVDEQLALDAEAKAAGINIIPDCGLAPGMVSILAMHGAKQFDQVSEIHIRVGGLPQNPKPPLNYQLVFSVEGLINEYIEKAH